MVPNKESLCGCSQSGRLEFSVVTLHQKTGARDFQWELSEELSTVPRVLETHAGSMPHSRAPSLGYICAQQIKPLFFLTLCPHFQPRICQKRRLGTWDADAEETRLAKKCLRGVFPLGQASQPKQTKQQEISNTKVSKQIRITNHQKYRRTKAQRNKVNREKVS